MACMEVVANPEMIICPGVDEYLYLPFVNLHTGSLDGGIAMISAREFVDSGRVKSKDFPDSVKPPTFTAYSKDAQKYISLRRRSAGSNPTRHATWQGCLHDIAQVGESRWCGSISPLCGELEGLEHVEYDKK